MLGDRIGKRRSVIGGASLACLFFALLPIWQGTLFVIILGIFVARAAFEFTIVSYGVLASEQTPEFRGKLLTQRVALSLIASFISTRFGPQIFEAFGVPGIALIGSISFGISAAVAFFLINADSGV